MNEIRDKEAEDYYEKATVYFTDMNPEALSGIHYFKAGWDAHKKRANILEEALLMIKDNFKYGKTIMVDIPDKALNKYNNEELG